MRLLNLLKTREAKRDADSVDAYAELVRDLAAPDAKEPKPTEVEDVLALAGKTPKQLERDIATVKDRSKDLAVVAAADGAREELTALEEEIEAAEQACKQAGSRLIAVQEKASDRRVQQRVKILAAEAAVKRLDASRPLWLADKLNRLRKEREAINERRAEADRRYHDLLADRNKKRLSEEQIARDRKTTKQLRERSVQAASELEPIDQRIARLESLGRQLWPTPADLGDDGDAPTDASEAA